jgi:hypothetical protein
MRQRRASRSSSGNGAEVAVASSAKAASAMAFKFFITLFGGRAIVTPFFETWTFKDWREQRRTS